MSDCDCTEADYVIALMAVAIMLMMMRPLSRAMYGLGVVMALATFVIGVLILPRRWK